MSRALSKTWKLVRAEQLQSQSLNHDVFEQFKRRGTAIHQKTDLHGLSEPETQKHRGSAQL